ncbi:hypothetical protein GCM10023185_07030 [Hymenobacter saemangeumensis]|uniref:RNA polymerase sigma-70 region 4 domain-containing protein n=1 Tax=Hymenobacter saemangeumensis TaxID=1084522 RepID=A0ABP8I2T2_9BACT
MQKSTSTLTLTPAQARAGTRQANYDKRNRKIKDAFFKRYTNQPRPKIYTREYVISQLAEEFNLSMARIEDILYKQAK